MKKPAILLLSLFVVACVPVSTGGSGQTTNGKPLAGTITVDQMKSVNNVNIVSPEGWTCTSTFGKSTSPGSMIRTVPLQCSNGAKGNLVLTGNQYQQQIVGSFQLNNGQSGQVIFGMT